MVNVVRCQVVPGRYQDIFSRECLLQSGVLCLPAKHWIGGLPYELEGR